MVNCSTILQNVLSTLRDFSEFVSSGELENCPPEVIKNVASSVFELVSFFPDFVAITDLAHLQIGPNTIKNQPPCFDNKPKLAEELKLEQKSPVINDAPAEKEDDEADEGAWDADIPLEIIQASIASAKAEESKRKTASQAAPKLSKPQPKVSEESIVIEDSDDEVPHFVANADFGAFEVDSDDSDEISPKRNSFQFRRMKPRTIRLIRT